ncbi:MAG: hypothetical protein V3V77_03870, partial [Candidatus Bipolaricaulota bacterium]
MSEKEAFNGQPSAISSRFLAQPIDQSRSQLLLPNELNEPYEPLLPFNQSANQLSNCSIVL